MSPRHRKNSSAPNKPLRYNLDPRLAMADPDQPGIIRFGSFEVDKRTGELRKNGSRIKLQRQSLQILLVLIVWSRKFLHHIARLWHQTQLLAAWPYRSPVHVPGVNWKRPVNTVAVKLLPV